MNDLPTLLLLPGMDGTGDLFTPFTEALGPAVNVKVVRYPLTKSLDYAELETFARAALPADGPFFILGESFSGPIAVALAAEAGPRLQGLILCSSFLVKHICPQTRCVDMDAPHFLLQARPIDAAQIIAAFLQGQAG